MNRGDILEYTTSLNLDMNPRGAPPVVRVKQGDGFSRFLQAQLTKDGVNFTPESGVDFIFRCIKPDGHGVLEDSINEDAELERYLVINQGNGVIQIELVDQVATAVGRCMCDLCLIKSEKILSTIPFVIEVVASPDVGSLAVSTDDFRTLVNLIDDVEHIIEDLAPELFEELEEMIAAERPKITSVTLPKTGWTGSASPYMQTVSVTGLTVTDHTVVDLNCGPDTIALMQGSLTTNIMIVNDNKTLKAYAIGGKPTENLTMQATVYETQNMQSS